MLVLRRALSCSRRRHATRLFVMPPRCYQFVTPCSYGINAPKPRTLRSHVSFSECYVHKALCCSAQTAHLIPSTVSHVYVKQLIAVYVCHTVCSSHTKGVHISDCLIMLHEPTSTQRSQGSSQQIPTAPITTPPPLYALHFAGQCPVGTAGSGIRHHKGFTSYGSARSYEQQVMPYNGAGRRKRP